MVQKIGTALVRNSDNAVVARWIGAPSRVDLPGTSDAVFGADAGWSNDVYRLVERWEDVSAFDPVTQVKEGPTTLVEATKITETYTVRSKTTQEIDAEKVAAVDTQINGSPYSVLLKGMFNLHNRIRVLEGQPTHTVAQFKTGLKALL